jgi:hypothetical protein
VRVLPQRGGIDRTVLYPTLGLTVGRIRDLDYSICLTRAYNDWIAETYLHHPSGKFKAAVLLPVQVPSGRSPLPWHWRRPDASHRTIRRPKSPLPDPWVRGRGLQRSAVGRFLSAGFGAPGGGGPIRLSDWTVF